MKIKPFLDSIVTDYGVMGNPIHHTRSPSIHQFFAKQTGLTFSYLPILVEPGDLAEAIAQFQIQGGKGLNITSPFKQEAVELVDVLSERASQARAINTIKFNQDGTRFGDNTDGIGFLRDITGNCSFSLKNKRMLIIGAGGAVRGMLGPLLNEAPAEVVIFNRTESKAVDLVNTFLKSGILRVYSRDEDKENNFDLIINSIAHPSSSFPAITLRKDTLCYDLAYGQNTPFLQWATHHGAKAVDGWGMLVEQAAESFYVWHGVRPRTTISHSPLESLSPFNIE